MKKLCIILGLIMSISFTSNAQLPHDRCEEAWLGVLDFCDYVGYSTDFSLAQDETSDPNVDPPCSAGPYNDFWFKLATNGRSEFGVEISLSGGGTSLGIELSDGCNGNVFDCDVYNVQSFENLIFNLPSVDSIWIRMWSTDNSYQGNGGFCFQDLLILSLNKINLTGESFASENHLKWEGAASEDWKRLSLEVYDENSQQFKTLDETSYDALTLISQDYIYADLFPKIKTIYRLAVLDHDDQLSYSNTLIVENNEIPFEINVSNPSREQLYIFTNNPISQSNYEIRIMDSNGREHIQTIQNDLTGFSIDISSLATGHFVVSITNQETTESQIKRFIKI